MITNHDDETVPSPGFRFYPTDEELLGFYLRRKVENKPIQLQLIPQVDIYKFDPWDLPKSSITDDNEWYFFCKRGRKYKNSVRPNRVTRSGFWKATGIDKSVYSSANGGCVGLKKSLVYYRGSAGKGTKTEWMMHEFRLPPTKNENPNNIDQEAEVWTLCRIVKRKPSHKKHTPKLRGSSTPIIRRAGGNRIIVNQAFKSCSETCSVESNCDRNYTNFEAPDANLVKPYSGQVGLDVPSHHQKAIMMLPGHTCSPLVVYDEPAASASSSFSSYIHGGRNNDEGLMDCKDWEDLQSVVNCGATNPFHL